MTDVCFAGSVAIRPSIGMNANVIRAVASWLRKFHYHSPQPVSKALAVVGVCASGKTYTCYEACRQCDLEVHTLSVIDSHETILRKLQIECNGYQGSFRLRGGASAYIPPKKSALIIDDIELCGFRSRTFELIIKHLPGLGMPILFTTSLERLPNEFSRYVDVFHVQKPTTWMIKDYLQQLHPSHPLLVEISLCCDRDLRQAQLLLACKTHTELQYCLKDSPHASTHRLREAVHPRSNHLWTVEKMWDVRGEVRNLVKTFMHYPTVVRDFDKCAEIAAGISDAHLFSRFDQKMFVVDLAPAVVANTICLIAFLHRPPSSPPLPPPPLPKPVVLTTTRKLPMMSLRWVRGAQPKKRTRKRKAQSLLKQRTLQSMWN